MWKKGVSGAFCTFLTAKFLKIFHIVGGGSLNDSLNDSLNAYHITEPDKMVEAPIMFTS